MTSAILPASMIADASAALVEALDAKERELREQWEAGESDMRGRLDPVLARLAEDRERAACLGVLAEAVTMCGRAGTAGQMTVDAADFRTVAAWIRWPTNCRLPPLTRWVRKAGSAVPVPPDGLTSSTLEAAD